MNMHPLNSYSRLLFLFAAALLWSLMGFGQTYDYSMQYNRSSSASGNTSLMNAAANVSTSLYTGGLQLSLPIYTLKSKDLQIPISIAYTASNGVRPTDPNSCVGLNWMLSAGGSISRTVRGLPDESTYGYIGTNMEGNTAVSDFNTDNLQIATTFNNVSNASGGRSLVDGEPDLFTVTTPYFTVQFTLDQSGNAIFDGGSSGFQIVDQLYNNSANADIYGITVIDPQGTQYVFGTQSASRVLTTTSFFGTSMQFVSTWYLEKIVTLNSRDVVNFTYQQSWDESVRTTQLNKNYTSTFPSSPWPPTTNPSSFSGLTVMNVLVGTTVYNGPKFVSTITTKLGEADFTYTTNSYSYVNNSNPPALTAITIKQFNPITNGNTTALQTYSLTYTDNFSSLTGNTPPFADTTEYAADYRRLLNSITVTGSTTPPSSPVTLYNLSYYQGITMADRTLPQNCDYWGYQNSTTWLTDFDNSDQNWFLYPDTYRQPASFTPSGSSQAEPMAALLALKELDQLGGSKTNFYYQQNDYYNGSANVAAGGARISSMVRTLPTGETLTTSYNYYNGSGNSTGQICSDLYKHVRIYFGSTCCNLSTVSMSQSPYGISDDQGVTVGYSAVRVTDPNGGYTINNFTNFSDYPDVITEPSFFAYLNTSATYGGANVSEQLSSFSYKRGLPSSTTAYTAGGNKVSQDVNTYGTVDAGSPPPVTKAIGIQDMTWFLSSPQYYGVNLYHSNIEDWRLLQTVHTDYDQISPTTSSLSTTTTYTYAPDNRQMRSVSTTDSKGQNHTITLYYSDDANIPFETSPEQTALGAMAASGVNATSLLVHKVDSRNGSVRQWHNTYAGFPIGTVTNYYKTTGTTYTGSTAEIQQFFNYDAATSQMISANPTGGKSTSSSYAYNTVYPIVKIENAANSATSVNQTATVNGILNIPPNTWGAQTANFTTTATGTITISMPPGSYLAGGVTCFFSFSLTNAGSNNLCESSVSGYTCSAGNSYSYPNMPAGNYTLSVAAQTNTATSQVPVDYSYQGNQVVPSGSTEFFFEGFEQNTLATSGSAHSGNMYFNGPYTVQFTPPNSRQYMIQWWNLSGSIWVFNQMPYTANMTLAGPVDDVRVFPVDALMTTYTYSPMVGKTSETDPSGKTKTFEYDGLGRLLRIRDQDGNILKQYDYEYQVGLSQ